MFSSTCIFLSALGHFGTFSFIDFFFFLTAFWEGAVTYFKRINEKRKTKG